MLSRLTSFVVLNSLSCINFGTLSDSTVEYSVAGLGFGIIPLDSRNATLRLTALI